MENATYKYAVGSKVWVVISERSGFLERSAFTYRAKKATIKTVEIFVGTFDSNLNYYCFSEVGNYRKCEDEVFATKEEAEEYIRKFKIE